MADEQGTDVDDFQFARADPTGANVNEILDNVGSDGRRLVPQSSAPSNPVAGDLYLSDGGNYDPVSNSGNAAVIIYDGSSWVQVADVGSDLS
jgi:hypothetical protein